MKDGDTNKKPSWQIIECDCSESNDDTQYKSFFNVRKEMENFEEKKKQSFCVYLSDRGFKNTYIHVLHTS